MNVKPRNVCPRCGLQQGFVVSPPDACILDNRDGFWDAYPDPCRTYDSSAFVTVPRDRLEQLLRIEFEATLRGVTSAPAAVSQEETA